MIAPTAAARIEAAIDRRSPASLVAQVPLLVLDVSPGGCLLESQRPVDAGRVGTVRLALNGEWYVEDIRITRCVPVPGRGSAYHLGAEFLRTRRIPDQSLRQAIVRMVGEVSQLGTGPC
jgi:hypothetical protein